MLAVPRLASIKRLALRAPFVRRALNYRYGRHFNAAAGHVRLFRGLYPDFASAAADIPKARLQGHDHDVSALRLAHDISNIYPFDYPILFWLQQLLPECKLLFDLGGNIGISYFAYQKYLSYPQQLVWQVCDLPAVAKRGEAIAAEPGKGDTVADMANGWSMNTPQYPETVTLLIKLGSEFSDRCWASTCVNPTRPDKDAKRRPR